MQPIGPEYRMRDFPTSKILALVVLTTFLIFTFYTVAQLTIFIPQMEQREEAREEAHEETSEMMEETGGGGEPETFSVIQSEFIPEVRLVYILSLVFFGLLDGIFAFMLWTGKPPYKNESILLPLGIIYIINRIVSIFVIILFSIVILEDSNPRSLMNSLYLSIPIFSAVSIVLILLFHKKIFGSSKRKGTKILFGVPDKTTL